jgi:hypothetical protein
MSQPPSPDTRIATAPTSTSTHEKANPGHGSGEHRSANYSPAIRAPRFSRTLGSQRRGSDGSRGETSDSMTVCGMPLTSAGWGVLWRGIVR